MKIRSVMSSCHCIDMQKVVYSRLVAFDKLMAICGHRLQKMDMYPTRYYATSFPNAEEREKLGVFMKSTSD